ncbi:AAA family ATPase [Plasticicumulans sp.]|uniref:AAA family ATPase n=1 Tax=Plasticicumulans sp. TaxID=2307179 RepID=UPI00321FF1A0
MRAETAIVKNIVRLDEAYEAVEQRDPGVEGMVLVYGATGAGKSTAIRRLQDRSNAIYTEASPSWSLQGMLRSIMFACGVDPKGRAADMEKYVVDHMMGENRPLIVDELDHLMLPGQSTTLRMLEALRSLYDKSGMPVVMVGMDKIDRKIKLREQLSRRIFQWVRFDDLDYEDIRTTADSLCEVAVADDLLDHLVRQVGARMGWIVPNLARIERRAKGNGWSEIDLAGWGDRPFQRPS